MKIFVQMIILNTFLIQAALLVTLIWASKLRSQVSYIYEIWGEWENSMTNNLKCYVLEYILSINKPIRKISFFITLL